MGELLPEFFESLVLYRILTQIELFNVHIVSILSLIYEIGFTKVRT